MMLSQDKLRNLAKYAKRSFLKHFSTEQFAVAKYKLLRMLNIAFVGWRY